MRKFLILAALAALILPTRAAAQWELQDTGTRAEFRGLDVSGARIWATGTGGVVATSADGGATWRADSIPGASNLFLVDVAALGSDTAVVLGTDFNGGLSRFYRTLDGGATWTMAHEVSGAGVFMDGLAFWDERRGVAFGDPADGAFMILLTSDGGASWRRVPADRLPQPLEGEAAFAASGRMIDTEDAGLGWIATGGGAVARLLRTTDYGESWTALATPMAGGEASGLFAIDFRDARNGIAVGGNYTDARAPGANVMRTTDGGETWELVQGQPVGVIYGGAWVPGTDVFLTAGPPGTGLSRDAGMTWQSTGSDPFNTVVAAGPGAAWAAGTNGRIARWAGR